MITNFWILITDLLRATSAQVGVNAFGDVTERIEVNWASVDTDDLINVPLRMPRESEAAGLEGPVGWGLLNCYIPGEYGVLTPLRENLQELEARYPDDFVVGGAYDVSTGEPVGGVGNPWFPTPPLLYEFAPPQSSNDYSIPTDIQQGTLANSQLLSGQASRKFV